MRNRCSSKKTLSRLSRRAGFTVVDALTRGGTDHRFDVVRDDGTSWELYADDSVQPFPTGHSIDRAKAKGEIEDETP